MKILFEVCHPAHVHYFRNLIKKLESHGHEIRILAQNRGIIQKLLQNFNFQYEVFPNLPKNIIGKLAFIPFIDSIFYKETKKIKPDLLIGFAGAYVAHTGWLRRIPSIVLDDTENANLSHMSYKMFASVILTPSCFSKNFSNKHIKFDSYMELSYLHPNYLNFLNTVELRNTSRKKILLRFVSWRATHDVGQKGFTYEAKMKIVESLSNNYEVIISSEEELPETLEKYKYQLSPEKIHALLNAVDLYIGEGATMASECAMLGTPAIYVNTLNAGTLREQENYGLINIFNTAEGVLEKAHSILQTPDLKHIYQTRRQKMLSQKIDITAFMVWFVENYPMSFDLMKRQPDYQYNFK
jgi:hypothetical protein